MNLELGDSIGFVSGVYLGVLIPWTILYTVDFISSKWETIGVTITKGWIHLVIITIPISSIVAYVVLQTQLPQPDYKEMYTAISALVLSGYHLARTVWGLRQLHYFREWATAVQIILESGSYECDIKPTTNKNGILNFFSRAFRKRETFLYYLSRSFYPNAHIRKVCPCESCKDSRRIRRNVNRLLVNNSLVDNEFFAGIAPHVKPRHFLRPLSMKPSKPFVTFARWATALVAQLGRTWLDDTTVNENRDDPWLKKRRRFAMQVLTTAMLYMDPDKQHGYRYPEEARFVSPDSESVLPPLTWTKITRHKTNGSHVFSHKEVLTAFFKDGSGLPFRFPALEKDMEVSSHRFLWPDLKEAKNALTSAMQEKLENFEAEHLELFSIFLWVQKHAPKRNVSEVGMKATGPNSSYRLLQRQLGLGEDDRALNDLPYSFCMHGRRRHLWFNRSILEVSCRIDNWLALCNGEQEIYMRNATKKGAESDRIDTRVRFDVFKNDRPLPQSYARQPMNMERGIDQTDQSLRETTFRKNEEVETKSLRFQLANEETPYDHAEQSLTFMGCVMESLRSGLAENAFTNSTAPTGDQVRATSWKVPIPTNTIDIPISKQLRACLLSPKYTKHRYPHSAIHERLLWECQVGTHHVFQGALTKPNVYCELSSMILFILGFPSIVIQREHIEVISGLGKCMSIRIGVAMAPQPIYVHVSIPRESSDPFIRLDVRSMHIHRIGEGSPKFDWDTWRCAFEGRLQAKASWQESHDMINVSYEKTQNVLDFWKPVKYLPRVAATKFDEKRSGSRQRLCVWEGWKPFREGMAIFELKYWFYVGSKKIEKVETSAQSLVEIDNEEWERIKEIMRIAGKEYGSSSSAVLNNGMSLVDTRLETDGSGSVWKKLDKEGIGTEATTEIMRRVRSSPPAPGWNFDFWKRTAQRFLPLSSNQSDLRDHSDPSDIYVDSEPLNPKAMFKKASWLLKGDNGYRQDREAALTMMEYAVHIDKDVDNALSYVKTCLDGIHDLFYAKRDEYLDRAFSAVNVLWTDVETRLESGKKEWKSGDTYFETNRLKKIIDIHQKLVEENHRSGTFQNFAHRLTMSFHVSGNREWQQLARQLYESLIIAEGDVLAMIKLALLIITKKDEDLRLAHGLYRRAMKGDRKEHHNSIEGYHFDLRSYSTRFMSFKDVDGYLRYEYEQGHVGAQLLLHYLMEVGDVSEKTDATKEFKQSFPTTTTSSTTKRHSEEGDKNESKHSMASRDVVLDLR